MNAVRRHQAFSSNEHHEPGLRARGAREDSLFYPSLSLILFLTRREINPRVHARARSHPVGVQSRHREARRLTRIAAPFDGPGLGPWATIAGYPRSRPERKSAFILVSAPRKATIPNRIAPTNRADQSQRGQPEMQPWGPPPTIHGSARAAPALHTNICIKNFYGVPFPNRKAKQNEHAKGF